MTTIVRKYGKMYVNCSSRYCGITYAAVTEHIYSLGSIPIPVFYIRNITEIGTNICYEGSLKVSPGYIFNWSGKKIH